MKALRTVLFWTHFVFALVTGAVIGVMAISGTTLAFRDRIIAASERTASHVEVPAGAQPMAVTALLRAVRDQRPDAQAQMAIVSRDPRAAVQVSLGRGDIAYVNPYTGELHPAGHAGLRNFFETVEQFHRWFALTGTGRDEGKAITGLCCTVYLLLILSGLWLWWPRALTLRAFRRAARPRFDARGKARDWNWHTTAGFWASPILLMTTMTGLFMAYPHLADLLFGPSTPPAAQAVVATPASGKTLGLDARLASVEAAYPNWQTITLRLGGNRGPARPGEGHPADAHSEATHSGGSRPNGGQGGSHGNGHGRPAVGFSVMTYGYPRLMQEIVFDPSSGEAVPASGAPRPSWGDWVRSSVKQFHLGLAGGLAGQALVFMGGLASLLLVFTGFALGFRRLFGRSKPAAGIASVVSKTVLEGQAVSR